MKVRVFCATSSEELENQINSFIGGLEDMMVLDIKYSATAPRESVAVLYTVFMVLQEIPKGEVPLNGNAG